MGFFRTSSCDAEKGLDFKRRQNGISAQISFYSQINVSDNALVRVLMNRTQLVPETVPVFDAIKCTEIKHGFNDRKKLILKFQLNGSVWCIQTSFSSISDESYDRLFKEKFQYLKISN